MARRPNCLRAVAGWVLFAGGLLNGGVPGELRPLAGHGVSDCRRPARPDRGEESITGKSLGTDVEQQKLTLPIIFLLGRSSARQAGTPAEDPVCGRTATNGRPCVRTWPRAKLWTIPKNAAGLRHPRPCGVELPAAVAMLHHSGNTDGPGCPPAELVQRVFSLQFPG